jgi:hypothetical protein
MEEEALRLSETTAPARRPSKVARRTLPVDAENHCQRRRAAGTAAPAARHTQRQKATARIGESSGRTRTIGEASPVG